jgi:hypothetical protein
VAANCNYVELYKFDPVMKESVDDGHYIKTMQDDREFINSSHIQTLQDDREFIHSSHIQTLQDDREFIHSSMLCVHRSVSQMINLQSTLL